MAKQDEKLQAYEELTTQMNASTVALDAEKRQKLHEILHQKPEFAQLLEKFKALCSDNETRKAISEICPASEADDHFDFKAMLQSMGAYCKIDPDKDGYVFNWPGKQTAIQLANEPTEKTLIPDKADSRDWDTTQNIYIEGDNLEALKCLRNAYAGKVKMIYIDPPYNADAMTSYCDYFHGEKVSSDDAGNHTKWLNMLYPRLMLARELLKEDGVICIQIDNAEYSNLKQICDKIYGHSNHINTIAVKMCEPTGLKMAHTTSTIPKVKEYILCYKNSNNIIIRNQKVAKSSWDSEYRILIEGVSKKDICDIKELKESHDTINAIAEIDNKLKNAYCVPLSSVYKEFGINSNDEINKYNIENSWRIVQIVSMSGGAKAIADSKKNVSTQQLFSISTPKGEIYLINGNYSNDIEKPRCKLLFADDYLEYYPCDFWSDIKTTGLDNEGGVPFRNGKKPLKLLERLIMMFTNQNDIVLDFFSGSGTTGHACLNCSGRKFMLVQLNEDLDLIANKTNNNDVIKQIDFLSNYNKKHLISEIGKLRLRFAGDKIKQEEPNLDIGFRVFRVGKSNIPKWWAVDDAQRQLNMFDNEEDKRTDEEKYRAIAYEFMLKHKCMLDARVDEFLTPDQMAKTGCKPLFVVDGALFICPVCGVNAAWAASVVALRRSRYAMTSNDAWFVAVNDTLGDSSDNRDSDKLLAVKTLVEAGLPAKHFLHI